MTIFGAIVFLGVFLELSPRSLQNTSLSWLGWDKVTGHDNFYFKKRQWLADARTFVEGVSFLCNFTSFSQSSPMDVALVPSSSLDRSGNSTNLTEIERPTI
jgi:hypothetical protein